MGGHTKARQGLERGMTRAVGAKGVTRGWEVILSCTVLHTAALNATSSQGAVLRVVFAGVNVSVRRIFLEEVEKPTAGAAGQEQRV